MSLDRMQFAENLTYVVTMIKLQLFHFFLICSLSLFTSCGLLNKKGKWGKDALYPIRSERILKSFRKNISSAHVWVPMAGAGIISLGDYEKKVTNWVAEESHIYPDHKTADKWSDNFNDILKFQTYASTIMTPSLNEKGEWGDYLLSKARGAGVVLSSSSLSRYSHDRISEALPRERPNKSDRRSFPSSHTTKASAYNMINIKNYESIDMNDYFRIGLITFNTTMATGTAWARVEGHRHYPTDVLIGYALGSFMSGFIYDSLMNFDPMQSFVIAPAGGSWTALYVVQF